MLTRTGCGRRPWRTRSQKLDNPIRRKAAPSLAVSKLSAARWIGTGGSGREVRRRPGDLVADSAAATEATSISLQWRRPWGAGEPAKIFLRPAGPEGVKRDANLVTVLPRSPTAAFNASQGSAPPVVQTGGAILSPVMPASSQAPQRGCFPRCCRIANTTRALSALVCIAPVYSRTRAFIVTPSDLARATKPRLFQAFRVPSCHTVPHGTARNRAGSRGVAWRCGALGGERAPVVLAS